MIRRSIPLTDIKVEDQFWNRYTGLVTKEILPYQYEMLQDKERSHCLENFRIAAGLTDGEFCGYVFQDSDLAKWLEAAAYSLAYEPNAELEERMDELIELVASAQEENGYLDTFFSIRYPGRQFCNLKEGHELYTAGHFIEAAVAYYQVTGKTRLLEIMRRCADNICRVFHEEGYLTAVPGHEEVELALVKLSDATGDEKYAAMAKDFLDRRGSTPNYLAEESSLPRFIDVWHDKGPFHPEYNQSHKPVREQDTAEGHAVRVMYLLSAMADIAERYSDEELLNACRRLYENITRKRMYITGGVGTSSVMERFTTDYDLPNDRCYCESCASVGLLMFCRRMARVTGEAHYMDTAELALMNTVLAGVSLDGKRFFYVNPLEVVPENCIEGTDIGHVKAERQPWFGCACCPPNIARTLASLGETMFFADGKDVWVNLYIGSCSRIPFGGGEAVLKVESGLPYKGDIRLTLTSEKPLCGTLWLRLPGYAEEPTITLNGEQEKLDPHKGYQAVRVESMQVELALHFEMPARVVYGSPRLHSDNGKCAVMKGPLVYCLEEQDNGKRLGSLILDRRVPLKERLEPEMMGGTWVVTGQGFRLDAESFGEDLYSTREPRAVPMQLRFVPYCLWGNRTPGEMRVWVTYKL